MSCPGLLEAGIDDLASGIPDAAALVGDRHHRRPAVLGVGLPFHVPETLESIDHLGRPASRQDEFAGDDRHAQRAVGEVEECLVVGEEQSYLVLKPLLELGFQDQRGVECVRCGLPPQRLVGVTHGNHSCMKRSSRI